MRAPALPTGFEPLDSLLDGGLRPHDLTLVAGKPSVGKTVATLQWARNVARHGGHTAYISYEHSEHSLLARLLNLELSESPVYADEAAIAGVRSGIKAWVSGHIDYDSLLDIHPVMEAAGDELMTYASRMFLIQGSSVTTGLAELAAISRHVVGPGGLIVIDYLQKVPVEGGASLDRAPEVAAALKEIAMTDHVAVLAICAVGHDGIAQRRIRSHHLASNAPLVHEADCALVLNDKAAALSRVHTAFDGRQVEEARRWTLFTIEKHRDGPASIDLEFAKDFRSFRFDPNGGHVAEHLVDDMTYSD